MNVGVIERCISNLSYQKLDVKYSLTTNGTIINDELLELILANDISISLSLDGSKENHDRSRKFKDGSGTFDVIMRNVQILRDIKNIRTRMTVTPSNVCDLYHNYTSLFEMGFENIGFVPDITSSWSENQLKKYEENVTCIVNYLELADKQLSRDLLNNIKNIEFKCIECDGGTKYIHIDSRGHVFPCMLTLGNEMFDFGFISLYDPNEVVKKFAVINSTEVNTCVGCGLYSNCRGVSCKYVNKILTGDFLSPPIPHCEIQKTNYFILKECDIL